MQQSVFSSTRSLANQPLTQAPRQSESTQSVLATQRQSPFTSPKLGQLITPDFSRQPPAHMAPANPSTSDLACHAELLHILTAAPQVLSPTHAFAHKEQALLQLFSTLSLVESQQLFERLAKSVTDHALAADPPLQQFHTMVVERRHRLLQFLDDAPRRAVINARRR
jgi:hypothetical protein